MRWGGPQRGCPIRKEWGRAETPVGQDRLLCPSPAPSSFPPHPVPIRPPREGQLCRLKLQEVEDKKI